MNRLWNNIRDNKYFTYFAVVILGIIKLLLDNINSNDTYLHFGPLANIIAISIYVAALIHLGLVLLTMVIIYLRFDKSFDRWQKDNNGKKIKKLIDKLLIKPALLTLVIVIYGFFIFLTISVFSWTYFFIFFGAMLTAKIIRALYNLRKTKTQQKVRRLTTSGLVKKWLTFGNINFCLLFSFSN